MIYQVVFAPEALEQLAELYRHIALAASPEIAAGYTDAIVSYCEGFATFPHRGTTRDDIRTGLRITNYKKRAVIAFAVDGQSVSILGVFYGGQDFETILQDDPEEGHKH
jgi:plasmid stabilization system protein ParE